MNQVGLSDADASVLAAFDSDSVGETMGVSVILAPKDGVTLPVIDPLALIDSVKVSNAE